MLRAVICKGDPTSHGGKVLEGNELVITNGRPVAQRGHMTFCPLCKGNFPISEGLDFHTYAGIGTAVDGMQADCGAKLIATQHAMVIDDGGGSGSSTAQQMESESAASSQAGAPAEAGTSFQAIDEHTGLPVPGLAYRLELPDGGTFRGVTDQEGRTERVTGHAASTVALYWEAQSSGDER
jgi:uncharacterized Zn-binding protein involved in type VI secretion